MIERENRYVNVTWRGKNPRWEILEYAFRISDSIENNEILIKWEK
jgi:hypothetical protein